MSCKLQIHTIQEDDLVLIGVGINEPRSISIAALTFGRCWSVHTGLCQINHTTSLGGVLILDQVLAIHQPNGVGNTCGPVGGAKGKRCLTVDTRVLNLEGFSSA